MNGIYLKCAAVEVNPSSRNSWNLLELRPILQRRSQSETAAAWRAGGGGRTPLPLLPSSPLLNPVSPVWALIIIFWVAKIFLHLLSVFSRTHFFLICNSVWIIISSFFSGAGIKKNLPFEWGGASFVLERKLENAENIVNNFFNESSIANLLESFNFLELLFLEDLTGTFSEEEPFSWSFVELIIKEIMQFDKGLGAKCLAHGFYRYAMLKRPKMQPISKDHILYHEIALKAPPLIFISNSTGKEIISLDWFFLPLITKKCTAKTVRHKKKKKWKPSSNLMRHLMSRGIVKKIVHPFVVIATPTSNVNTFLDSGVAYHGEGERRNWPPLIWETFLGTHALIWRAKMSKTLITLVLKCFLLN